MARGWLAPLAALAVAVCAATAAADTFPVTTVIENDPGSLQEAVQAARDSASVADTLVLDPTDGTSFTLSAGLGDVGEFFFDGSAQTGLVFDGSGLGATPIFSTTAGRLVTLRSVGYLGSLSIGGPLDFDEPDPAGVSEVDSATGLFPSLRKLGPGTTRITGAFDFLNLGSLSGDFQVDEGTLEVAGSGSVRIQSFSVQSGGRLHVDGSLDVETFDLFSGGLLSGDGGTVGALAPLVLRGRIAPGSPGGVGTLELAGAPRFRSGSVLEIDLVPGGGDTLTVSSLAPQIDSGAQLLVSADTADFPNAGDSTTHTVFVSSDADIDGQFQVMGPVFFDPPGVMQSAREIEVTLTRSAGGGTIESLGRTRNQRAVGAVLDADGGALAPAIAELLASPANEITGLLDAIGGETLTATATARHALAERSARALQRRVRDPSWGSARAFYADAGGDPAYRERPDAGGGPDDGELPDVASFRRSAIRAGAWLDGFGAFGSFEGGSRGAADLDVVLAGATVGLDAWIHDEFVAGVAAGYARSEVSPDGRDHDLSADTVQGALYGGWSAPEGFATAYARYAHSFLDSEREIEGTVFDREAEADWEAQDWGVGAEAGLTVLSSKSVGLQPIVGVDYFQLDEESYRESGAAELNLSVRPDQLESLTTRVGARLFGEIDLDGAGLLAPELRAFWQHEYGDTERRLSARLAGATVPVRGAELPRDAAIVGLGWSAEVGEALTVFLDYDTLLDADRIEHQGTLAVRLRF